MIRPVLLDVVSAHGFAVFERGLYNLNIVGLRNDDRRSNLFNDRIAVAYRDRVGWVTRTFKVTTDPGLYWRENPINVDGTAIMCPGQYRGSHRLGLHRGQYRALCQTGGPVRYWRDSNRDEVLDMVPGSEDEGFIGLNIHRSAVRRVPGRTPTVSKFSAGCQVFEDPTEYDAFIDLCEKSAALYGNRFTYTLIPDLI